MKYLLLALLAGCAIFDNAPGCVDRGDGLCWYANPVQIPVSKVVWEVDKADNVSSRCNIGKPVEHATCVLRRGADTCHVVSALTELQAKNMAVPTPVSDYQSHPRSIYWHEVADHCGILPNGTFGTQWNHRDIVSHHMTEPR